MRFVVHIPQKIKYTLLVLSILALYFLPKAGANCGGVLENGVGSWTVTADCTVSNGLYSIWGNTVIGPRTVTVAPDAAIITNLVSNSVTFSTGKMLFNGNGVMYGNSSEFTWYNPSTTGTIVPGGSKTSCPSGTRARNPITKSFIVSGVEIHASKTGWAICKSFTPIGTDGVCGISDGVNSSSLPNTNLCHSGTVSIVTTTGTGFIWTCSGLSGGVTVSCSAQSNFIIADKVRITQGTNNYMSLAEVQIYPVDSTTNVALAGTATQTSYALNGVANRAKDGNTNGIWGGNSVTHTSGQLAGEYWEIQLSQDYPIAEVKVWNRADCCGDRMIGTYVTLYDNGVEVWRGNPFINVTTQSAYPSKN